jgi:FkbM family methyltransferase
MKNKIKHSIWIVMNFWGYTTGFSWLAPLHQTVALFALHGLGYDNRYGGNITGEKWFINNILPAIGDAACIDIGAHVGHYSEWLAQNVKGQIYAVEPLSSSFAILEKQTNKRIHPFRLAITDFDGTAPIFSHKASGEDATLSEGVILEGSIREEIPVLTLDTFVTQQNIQNVGFVKIDTEGHEMEVLSGMKNLVQNNPPKFVQFEFNFGHLQRGHTLLMLTKLLPGYGFYRIVPHGMLKIDPDKYIDNLFMYSNIIAKRK